MRRRDFLITTGAGAAAGLGLLTKNLEAADQPPTIQSYKTLGRTGLKMSDISFGCGDLNSPSLAARALDMGINYFDTAPDYGESEESLGKFVKKSGKRDKMIIATKFCRQGGYPSHLDYGSRESDYIAAAENSLKRIQTDYLDIIFVHAMGEKSADYEKRLFDEEMLNAFAKLKKAGKARFLAVSSHGPVRMEELLRKAIRSGHFDIIMPAFNFMKHPNIPTVLFEAEDAGIGVVAMKTLAGAKDMNLDPGDEPLEHAAFKWVLKHTQVSGLIVTIKNFENLNHYVKASGQPYTQSSRRTLDKYMAAHSAEYCRTGCGECLDSCPDGVNVAGVLRQLMYFRDYGDQKRAMLEYSGMAPKADSCASCENAPCQTACPYGLRVADMLIKAHEDLSIG